MTASRDTARLEQLEAELSAARDALARAEEAGQRDRERIQQLNARIYLVSRSCHADLGRKRRIESWMDQLQHDFTVLLSSRRWRLGNRLIGILQGDFKGEGKPGALLHAEQVFREFATWKKKMAPLSGLTYARRHPGRRMSVEWLFSQLERDLTALAGSRRYRVGLWLARARELLLLRERSRALPDEMGQILKACDSACRQENAIAPEKIRNGIERFAFLFRELEASPGLRMGNRVAGIFSILTLKEKSLKATDHIAALLADYERGRYFVPGLEPPGKSFPAADTSGSWSGGLDSVNREAYLLKRPERERGNH